MNLFHAIWKLKIFRELSLMTWWLPHSPSLEGGLIFQISQNWTTSKRRNWLIIGSLLRMQVEVMKKWASGVTYI